MFYCDGAGENGLWRDQSCYDEGDEIEGISLTVMGWGLMDQSCCDRVVM